jgi:hypothetical protein
VLPAQPLKIVAVFPPNLLRGGAEQWLLYLARFLDRRAMLTRYIVTNGRAGDPEFTAGDSAPVERQRAIRSSERCATATC